MTDKLQNFKKRMTEKERENRASTFYNQIKTYLNQININALKIGALMKHVRDEKLFVEMQCDTFEIFCCLPEISIQPSTVKQYIRVVEFIEEKNIEIDSVCDIAINKIELLKDCKKPIEWIEPARDLAYNDLKKEIRSKEMGIDSEDNEVKKYIKKEEAKVSGCEFWDGKKCLKDSE